MALSPHSKTLLSHRLLTGRCYCGGLRYEVQIPVGKRPHFSGYCHCDSCRRAHAAPLYQVVIMEANWFEIVAGAELLKDFTRPGARITRAFCSACGTRIVNRFSRWRRSDGEPISFFPNTLDEPLTHPFPELLQPEEHNREQECVLDLMLLAKVESTATR